MVVSLSIRNPNRNVNDVKRRMFLPFHQIAMWLKISLHHIARPYPAGVLAQ
jgi:hypothetical protein